MTRQERMKVAREIAHLEKNIARAKTSQERKEAEESMQRLIEQYNLSFEDMIEIDVLIQDILA